jgi:hypothetical protein
MANITVALVAAHILGVMVASVVHKENLILAMVTGGKRRAHPYGLRSGHRTSLPGRPPASRRQRASATSALEVELQDGTVVADDHDGRRCVFLTGLYRAEREISERLRALTVGNLLWPQIDAGKADAGKAISLLIAMLSSLENVTPGRRYRSDRASRSPRSQSSRNCRRPSFSESQPLSTIAAASPPRSPGFIG